MSKLIKWLPLFILILGLLAFFYFGLDRYVTFATLQTHYQAIAQWTHAHFILATFSFVAVYVVMVALSIPFATLLTLLGGFLFGLWLGTLLVVVGATFGATILFLAAKTSLGALFEDKAGAALKKMEHGFQANAMSYLLVLRLVPLFPFWLVNIVPALLNVRLRIFVMATFIGIIPGSFVYVSIGNGLSALFAAGQTPDLGIIFKPAVLLPLLGLAVLSFIPMVYKHYKTRRVS